MQDKWPIIFTAIQGVLYLLYPFSGIVSQVYLGNFKIINASVVLFTISSFTMILISVINLWKFDDRAVIFEDEYIYTITIILAVVFLITSLTALTLYESNAIQFGMDQMIEASSRQLSSFIRWYFWCAHIGPSNRYNMTTSSVSDIYTRMIFIIPRAEPEGL